MAAIIENSCFQKGRSPSGPFSFVLKSKSAINQKGNAMPEDGDDSDEGDEERVDEHKLQQISNTHKSVNGEALRDS
jgi:hypothetical protein